eukprot:SAG31_NODE_1039_length_10212_cov_8.897063_5_plen_191_part_00
MFEQPRSAPPPPGNLRRATMAEKIEQAKKAKNAADKVRCAAPHYSTTQSWGTNSPMISNSSGAPVLHFGTTQAKSTQQKLGLDADGKPPMCHVIVNCIVAFFIPPLGHFLARPSDLSSPSFLGTLVVWVVAWILSGLPLLGDLLLYIGAPFIFLVTVYAIFVCCVANARQPYGSDKDKDKNSGVIAMERV